MNLKLSDKKVLVTGGAGFIGSNLCYVLLKLGNSVVCMDNLSTGKKTNIHSLLKNDNFKFFNADIRNLEDCINISKGIDYIFHQAALGSVPRSINDPVTTNDVNISGEEEITSDKQAKEIFGDKISYYLSGESLHGNGSTVVDLRVDGGEVLRQGPLKWPPSYC